LQLRRPFERLSAARFTALLHGWLYRRRLRLLLLFTIAAVGCLFAAQVALCYSAARVSLTLRLPLLNTH
jgi:hypothetical protein